MREVRAAVEWLFGEIKSYKLFDFKSQMKIDLSSVAKADSKVADFFEINPITVIFCYCPDI